MNDERPDYHRGWDAWIVRNLARGASPKELLRRLTARGFAEEFSAARIRALAEPDVTAVAEILGRETGKLQSLLDVLGELAALNGAELPTVPAIAPDVFYREYVHRNRPLLIKGFAGTWPAVHRWSPRHVAAAMGDAEVQITAEREKDPRFEQNFHRHVATWRMDEFVRRIESGESTNDVYLVSKNNLLKNPAAAPLLKDFSPPAGFVKDDARPEDANFWMGPAGAVTPLHHDACNVLFCQIYGRKRVRLISPFFLPRLYNEHSCFSDFDPEWPDFERFPLMKGVPILLGELEPGDALFIPVGWWHHVRSLLPSISLSFTGLRLPREANLWRSPTD